MSLHLPELLRALAEIFARPGAFPSATLAAARNAFWVSEPLKGDLEHLLASETPDLAVAYTDHFLVSREHPVLHLEASVHRTGLLRDPALLHDLDHHYEAFGFEVAAGLGPDHLATELQALAMGLQRLGNATEEELPKIVSNLLGLVDLHLLPLLTELNTLACGRAMHPVYAAALAATSSCVELVRDGIFAFT